jgi:uncharacterized damage-inducible protein DinB
MPDKDPVREHLALVLDWHEAHATLDQAVKGLPPRLRGALAQGLPHSIWQLVEHIRLAQKDILEFATRVRYRNKNWPADYWPKRPAPPSPEAWRNSLRDYHADLRALAALARNAKLALDQPVPSGTGQTILRELLLTVDHTAYHVGQIVLVRRALGAWPQG